MALKKLSESSGMSMGTWANFLVAGALMVGDGKMASQFPIEIQTALAADIMSAIGDLFKVIGLEAIKQTSISELYQNLLSKQKDK